jgi:hypothetical protein
MCRETIALPSSSRLRRTRREAHHPPARIIQPDSAFWKVRVLRELFLGRTVWGSLEFPARKSARVDWHDFAFRSDRQQRADARPNRKYSLYYRCFMLVGAEGFEPPTLCSQSRCATRLRYAPTCFFDCTVNRNPGAGVEETESEWEPIKRDQDCCTSVPLLAS